jgi:hypothetical protein
LTTIFVVLVAIQQLEHESERGEFRNRVSKNAAKNENKVEYSIRLFVKKREQNKRKERKQMNFCWKQIEKRKLERCEVFQIFHLD